mmetsp:Transcript_22133/g.61506  ORF Transcript_22133/g.61506 Transcript_22133/m.61506 type:complete len:269 (+) Transcript_22133:641-1447(+)
MGRVAHNGQLAFAGMVLIAVHLGRAVPLLTVATNPLFGKVVIVDQFKGFEMLLKVVRHHLHVVGFQFRCHLGVTRAANGNVDQTLFFFFVTSTTIRRRRGHGQTNPIHTAGQAGGQQRHAVGIERRGFCHVHGPKLIENIAVIHFKIVHLCDEGLSDDGPGPVGPHQQVVRQVIFVVLGIHVARQDAVSRCVHVLQLRLVPHRQVRIIAVMIVQVPGHGGHDVIAIDNVSFVGIVLLGRFVHVLLAVLFRLRHSIFHLGGAEINGKGL